MAPAPPSVPSQKRAISVIDLDDSPPPSPFFSQPSASTSKPSTAIRGKEWLLAKVDELEGVMRVSTSSYRACSFVEGDLNDRNGRNVELTSSFSFLFSSQDHLIAAGLVLRYHADVKQQ